MIVNFENLLPANTIPDIDYTNLFSQLPADKEMVVLEAPNTLRIDVTEHSHLQANSRMMRSIIVKQFKVAA